MAPNVWEGVDEIIPRRARFCPVAKFTRDRAQRSPMDTHIGRVEVPSILFFVKAEKRIVRPREFRLARSKVRLSQPSQKRPRVRAIDVFPPEMRLTKEDGDATNPSSPPRSRRSPTVSGITKLGWGAGEGDNACLLRYLFGVAPDVVESTGICARLVGVGSRNPTRAPPRSNNTDARNGRR